MAAPSSRTNKSSRHKVDRDGFIVGAGYNLDAREYNEAGCLVPSPKRQILYVKTDQYWGNQDGENNTFASDHGDDNWSGEQQGATFDTIKPLRSVREVKRRIGRNEDGAVIEIRYMGSHGDTFDLPSKGRTVAMRSLPMSFGGGHESWRTSVIHKGPRGMLRQGIARKLVSATDMSNGSYYAGRTKLEFNGAISAAIVGRLMCMTQDGRQRMFPFGCDEQDEDGALYTCVASATTFDGYVNKTTDDWYPVIGAIFFASDQLDFQMNGINVYGEGPFRTGDRVSAYDPTHDKNPESGIQNVATTRLTCKTNGDLWLNCVDVHDHIYVAPGCNAYGRNVIVEGFLDYCGGPTYKTAAAQYVSTEMAAGDIFSLNDEEAALTTNRFQAGTEPWDPTFGFDWQLAGQGACLRIGSDIGGPGGQLRIHKGLSVNTQQGSGTAIQAYGPNASLHLGDTARCCVVSGSSNSVAFRATDGARMRLNDTNALGFYAGPRVYGTTRHLAVGRMAAADAVQFQTTGGADNWLDAGGTDGNLRSSEDGSRIWNKSWEPSGYGRGT